MTVKGIDVASYQSSTPGTSGLSFLFTKATQGTNYVNPRMASQASTARKAGLVVGFYHFLVTGNIQKQAEYFVTKAASQEHDVLACDWENDPATGKHASCAEKDAFIKAVKKLRPTHKVVLYCNLSFWKSIDTTSYAGDGLWIADPSAAAGHPRVTHSWVFHQYGISGTDVEVANFSSKAALAKWAGGAASVPPPTAPTVDLSNLVDAAKKDPKAAQGHTTHPNDVKPVEAALKAEGLLSSKYANDGSFGSTTVAAYAQWQKKLGYAGKDADGIPGSSTLKKLGSAHGFKVKA